MAEGSKPDIRSKAYQTVRRYPGIHLHAIARHMATSTPLARYHLEKLRDEGWVEADEQGGYRRYFPTAKGKAAAVDDADKPFVGALRDETTLHIVLLLLDEGSQTHGQLHSQLGGAKSTLTYHLNKLIEGNLLRRDDDAKTYSLTERERTYRLLLTYTPTRDLLDAFADLWEDLYG